MIFRRRREPTAYQRCLAVHMHYAERTSMLEDLKPRNPIDWMALPCLIVVGLCAVALVIHAIAERML